MTPPLSRRTFLRSSLIATTAIITSKRTAAQNIVGEGDHKFQYEHMYPQLPDRYSWQTTHNVAVDPDNNLYVIHEGKSDWTDHPSIFVFDPTGKFIRAFGQQFQGGGHGLEVHVEDGTPFLYVAAYQQVKSFAKLTLDGEIVWQRYAPMQSGRYAAGEASDPQKLWGRDRFMPTNFAFLPDGDFLLADGYGAYCIHRFDADGNWKSSFGGTGGGRGTFNLPHGVWVDTQPGRETEIIVADRAHNTLQILGLDGEYRRTIGGFGLPANIDVRGDLVLVPELVARVSLLDRDYNTVATLGGDVDRISADSKKTIRKDESQWKAGRFVHPHDACFDLDGNIFVAEWVASGRVTKLTRA